MKTQDLLALLAVAGSASAFAAPRESVTLSNVPSIARQGNASNFVATLPATGSDGGGSYTAASLNISGAVGGFRGASWQREAMIRVTPPGGGTPFVVAPFSLGSATAGSVTGFRAVPVGAVTTAGTWTFEFFDDFDDTTASGVNASESSLGAYDALWSTVTIALDDAAPSIPAPGSGPSVTFTNVESDGLVGAPAQTRTWNNTQAPVGAVAGIRVRGLLTATSSSTANTAINVPGNARISVLPPGFAAPIVLWAADQAFTSSQLVDIVGSAVGITNFVGTWTINFYEGADQPGVDNVWQNVSLEIAPVQVPASEAIGTLVVNTTASREAVLETGQVKWYSFILNEDVSRASNRALSIDNEISSTTPLDDSWIALYNSNGTLRASDLGDGTESLGSLSFGVDSRTAPGNGLAYNGRDGSLLAGTYYIATGPGTAPTFNANFILAGVSSTATATSLATNVSYLSPGITLPPFVEPSPIIDAGVVQKAPADTETVVTATAAGVTDRSTPIWFKFSIPQPIGNASGFYVDIDTEGTNPGSTVGQDDPSDTNIGVYAGSGLFLASDDDGGSGWRSALSFGQSVPARAAVNTTTSTGALARNGRNGDLPAGTYYVAMTTFGATWPTTTSTSQLQVTPPAGVTIAPTDQLLNFRTNIVSCICCNLSNVAGPNQSTTPDDALTADDVIVFLGWYFANDQRANVAGPNQSTTPDNTLTADDVIVFLGRFFSGC